MFSRFSLRLIFPGLGVLALSLLSGFAASSGNSAAAQAPSTVAASTTAPPAAATSAAPATAAIPNGTAESAAARKSSEAATLSAAAASTASATAAPAIGATVAASSGTVYGIADPDDLFTQSASVQVQELEAMKAMGATSIRLNASWYWGQPNGPGSFDWTVFDQAVASIQKADLSADMIIDGCPPWAAASGAKGAFAQPASSAAFATWAGAVAARYGTKGVRYFEIWNEPNISDFWSPKPDPAAYTADLKAAYTAIKAVDPSAIVLSGGLAPADDNGTNYNPRTFLQDMYADGAESSFDGLGFHPYSYPDSPDTVASWSGWSMMADTTPSLRSIMTKNGDSGKKIWITEYGAPTSGPNSVGETGQSTDLVQAISQIRKLDWIGSFYIYTWRDLCALPADQDGFGLLTDTGVQKPAYSAVAAALSAVGKR